MLFDEEGAHKHDVFLYTCQHGLDTPSEDQVRVELVVVALVKIVVNTIGSAAEIAMMHSMDCLKASGNPVADGLVVLHHIGQ